MNAWRHNKSGEIYFVLSFNAHNCTNGVDSRQQVCYISIDRRLLCFREYVEFHQKFTKVCGGTDSPKPEMVGGGTESGN